VRQNVQVSGRIFIIFVSFAMKAAQGEEESADAGGGRRNNFSGAWQSHAVWL
jgi:hypothetical protein